MLHAREILCILLLVASALPYDNLHAQNIESAQAESRPERLGDDPVEPELELDLIVPTREAKPSEVPPVDNKLSQQKEIDRHLAAARAALQAGRIDQPANDCAWSHYRAVQDIDPQNVEAQQGLLAVQKALVSRAIEVAKELDFDLAELILEDAALVRESREHVDKAQEEIFSYRSQYAEEREVKAVHAMDAGDFALAERQLIKMIALGGADNTVSQLRRRLEDLRWVPAGPDHQGPFHQPGFLDSRDRGRAGWQLHDGFLCF